MSEINTYQKVKNDTKKNHTESLELKNPKSIVRAHLTPEIRISIAYRAMEAQTNKEWGVITALSKIYGISRTFVYILKNRLQSLIPQIFFPTEERKVNSKKEIIEKILSYRMEYGMSIGDISTVMKREGLNYSGASTIGQSLSAIGDLLPSIESIPMNKEFKVTLLLDEIFIGSQPILIIIFLSG